jgi:glucuronate isomerase
VLGIDAVPSEQTAARIWDETSERLRSPEFSTRGILKRFNIEYQSPVATLTDDLSPFDGVTVAPSLRADDLLSPTEVLKHRLAELSGIKITDIDSYVRAVAVMLDKFNAVGCRFADHSLDAGFFRDDEGGDEREMLTRLGCEYNRRGWTLLLHVGAKRKTSPRLARLAGPAGGYAAVGEGFELSSLVDTLGDMERRSGLPDTVLFPLNASDHAAVAVMQGAFSEDGVRSKVQLGPAWWWCDHEMGIRSVLDSVASYGAVAHFIGMTTDSRSVLSFARHDYFRRILCSWLAERNATGEWEMPYEVEKKIIEKICYANAKEKIKGDRTK